MSTATTTTTTSALPTRTSNGASNGMTNGSNGMMNGSNGLNGHHENQKCQICLKSSPSPHLSCGHPVCSACFIGKTDQNNFFACTVCSKPSQLGENDSIYATPPLHTLFPASSLQNGMDAHSLDQNLGLSDRVWNSNHSVAQNNLFTNGHGDNLFTNGHGDNTLTNGLVDNLLTNGDQRRPDLGPSHTNTFMENWSRTVATPRRDSDWPPPIRREAVPPSSSSSSSNNANNGAIQNGHGWPALDGLFATPFVSWSSVVSTNSAQGFPPPGASSPPPRFCSCDDLNNIVTSRCRECEEDLCDFCVEAHRRVKITRSHRVVKLRDSISNLPSSVSPVPAAMAMPVSQPQLFEASATPSAEVMKVYANVLEKAKAECDNLVVKVKLGMGELDKAKNRVSSMEGRIVKRHKSVVADIESIVESFFKTIQARHQVLTERLETVRHVKLSALADHKKNLDSISTRLSKVFDQLSTSIVSGAEFDLINACESANDVVKEAEQIFGLQQVSEDETIVFVPPDHAILKAISGFGFIGGSSFAKNSYVEGITTATIGNDMKFVIFVCDQLNERRSKGGDEIKVDIRDSEQQPIKYSIQDIQNGSYRINWKPLKEGDHVITIKIKNQHIRDSPFRIRVRHERSFYNVGEPRLTFGKEGTENGDFCRPWGVCCSRNGLILVANRSNNRIEVFTSRGDFLHKFGTPGKMHGELERPSGVCCDSKNRVVVADKDNHRIQIFTIEGSFLDIFGEKGSKNGQFNYPWDVACNDKDQILVSDTRNHRVQLFSPTGEFLQKYGFDGTMWKHFDSPRGVCFKADGKAVITDFNNHRVLVVDLFAQTAQSLGLEGSGDGMFTRPNGIAVDDEGNIFVADSRNDRVQIFSNTGVFITKFGCNGSLPGQFDRPAGIAVSPEGFIYVVDFGNSRVQVF